MRATNLAAFLAIALVARTSPTIAATLFSGNFVVLSTEREVVDIGVNYPRPGSDEICGIELKSRPIVLHARAWQKVADALEVTEVHEDGSETIAPPPDRQRLES